MRILKRASNQAAVTEEPRYVYLGADDKRSLVTLQLVEQCEYQFADSRVSRDFLFDNLSIAFKLRLFGNAAHSQRYIMQLERPGGSFWKRPLKMAAALPKSRSHEPFLWTFRDGELNSALTYKINFSLPRKIMFYWNHVI